jgi:hypothetical protein
MMRIIPLSEERTCGCESRLRMVVVGGLVSAIGMEGCGSNGQPCARDDCGTSAVTAVDAAGAPETAASDGFAVGSEGGGGPNSGAWVFDGSADDARGSSGDGAASAVEAAAATGGDAGQPEAAVEAGNAACVTSGTELCDGFESGQIDPKVWKIVLLGPSASVTVDSAHAHSGQYAVHAKVTPGQQSTAQIAEGVTFPATDDTFYTRIWAYISPAVMWPNNPPDFHTGFIIAGGNNDHGHVELAVGANLSPSSSAGPMHYLGYSIYRGPPYVEFGPRSPTPVVNVAWTCIELLESGKGGAAAVRRIWADGVELTEQNNTFSGQKPPQFDLVSIGIWEYHPTPSLADMWIDDVRVSSQRVGCGS